MPLFVASRFSSRDRLHSATVWGTPAILAMHVLRMPIASTAAWQAFARWAVQLIGASV